MSINTPNKNRGNIQIVDDTLENLDFLASILTDKGYEVRMAINGELALKSIRSYLPDLILLDIIMPGLSGFDVCEQLKADKNTRHIPVIFISAVDDISNKVKGFALGGVDYITKPFQEEEVLARVNTHISLQKAQQHLDMQNKQLQQEVADRKQVEESLKESKGRLQESQTIARLGQWELDLTGNKLEWSDEIYRIFEIDPARFKASYEAFIETVHPDDRHMVNQAYTNSVNNMTPYEIEHRLQLKDGRVKFVREICRTEYDPDGKPLRSIGTVQDISAFKQVEEEMRKARDDAESANKAKSTFLANMSHEIRTPMNAVIGLTELTLQSDLSPEQRENLQLVRDSAYNLLDIINDILDFSKIEAGRISLECIDFNLCQLLEFIIQIFSVQAEKQGLFLKLICDDSVPQYIKGDQLRLRQIMVNLISNALKFTESGGVTLKAQVLESSDHIKPEILKLFSKLQKSESEGHPILFSVKDTGIGIPKDKQEKIFESFSQAGECTTRRYGGTGLGLTICLQLAELMGGLIWVESETGSGSTFFFLSIFQPGNREGVQSEVNKQICMIPKKDLKLKILIAEDNPVNAKVAVSFLSKMGHISVTASDGKKALSLLSSDSFDLVLMDLEMPEMNGMEAAKKIRNGDAGQENRNIPIIAMTAHALSEFREKCKAAGMNDFVTKPVDFYELGIVIERYFSLSAVSEKIEKTEPRECVFDKKYALRRLGGDEKLLNDVYELFITDAPENMEYLRQAVSADNMKDICFYAHSLKGMCGAVYAESCQNIAEKIEKIARKEDKSENIILVFEKLDHEFARIIEIIKEEHKISPDSSTRKTLTQDSFNTIPTDLLANLKQASLIGDVNSVKKIINKIKLHDKSLAESLKFLADRFEYETISDLVNNP